MNEPAVGFFIFIGIAGIAIRYFSDRLDRLRIRENVESNGGEIVRISWNPFGKGWLLGRNERIYEVTYRTRLGRTISATCRTSMWIGVYWTSAIPPGEFSDTPDEAAKCLSCGAVIPPSKSRCDKCGWSYEDV